jgi:hypothetical protein
MAAALAAGCANPAPTAAAAGTLWIAGGDRAIATSTALSSVLLHGCPNAEEPEPTALNALTRGLSCICNGKVQIFRPATSNYTNEPRIRRIIPLLPQHRGPNRRSRAAPCSSTRFCRRRHGPPSDRSSSSPITPSPHRSLRHNNKSTTGLHSNRGKAHTHKKSKTKIKTQNQKGMLSNRRR